MAYAITILSALDGQSFDKSLQNAFEILRSAHISVEGGAHIVSEKGHMMTLLIPTEKGQEEALHLLAETGYRVKQGRTD